MKEKIPNPGSEEALAQGCKCPVMDNAHGRGYYRQAGIFVYNYSCPLHGAEIKEYNENNKRKRK